MATRTIYECGCAEHGEQFWPCKQHEHVCRGCNHKDDEHTVIGCWAPECHCSIGYADGEWMR